MLIRSTYKFSQASKLVGQSNNPYLHITPILTYTADAAKLLQHCKTAHSKAKLKS